MPYCSNCSAELESAQVPVCPRCHVQFGAGSEWHPTVQPLDPGEPGLWHGFRKVVGVLLLVLGYGMLASAVLFLVFLFPRGTSSGSVLGLVFLGPPLLLFIAITIGLGHLVKPSKVAKK